MSFEPLKYKIIVWLFGASAWIDRKILSAFCPYLAPDRPQ
jgi:hypothetical protein